MMFEKRKSPRLSTHIVAKMSESQELQSFYGYIENLSESGLGIVSMDLLKPVSRLTCSFFLDGISQKINVIASLIHTRKDVDMVYYYGFRFDYLSQNDHETIRNYIGKEYPKASPISGSSTVHRANGF